MADIDLQEIHDVLIDIAHEAGRMMLSATPTSQGSDQKLNSADLVTQTDKAVETMVSDRLRSKYPTYSFIGEETYTPGQNALTDAPTFICDPIDGTMNFVHTFPFFCISLGFSLNKTPSVGVIYCPYLNELYTAIKGKGAFLIARGAKPICLPLKKNPEPLTALSNCLVACEWANDRQGSNYELKAKVYTTLARNKKEGGRMVQGIRSNGSSALNLSMVASGQMDLYWEGGNWAWDVCAGWCILVEAGGKIAGANPGVWDPKVEDRKYVAVRGAPSGQDEVIREFWGLMGEGTLSYSV